MGENPAPQPADGYGVLPEALRRPLDDAARQHDEFDAKLADPDVLADHNAVRELSIKRAAVAPVVEAYSAYRAACAEIDEFQSALSGSDEDLAEMARDELPGLKEQAESLLAEMKSRLVTTDDRRIGRVILELRAGTGGDEAGLWARDLLEMYTKYAARASWTVEPLSLTEDGSVGGVRHAVLAVSGEAVWQRLAFEAGVHSVKRVPATETQGRVHTSTATVAVLPEPEAVDVSVDWSNDVEEHITTAQGPGGQNVNKVATAVLLRHIPTGIEVRMQETKSQQQNREKARRLLAARLHELERQRLDRERAAERKDQIGSGQRSEKIRVYRFQDGIVADQRLSTKLQLRPVLFEADLDPMFDLLIEQETARRLAAL